MSGELSGRVALVTGASGGIGSAICRRLAEAGASVVITYNQHREKAAALEQDLAGAHHLVAPLDLTSAESLERLARDVSERYGGLAILVNNAGMTRRVPHDNLDALDDALIDEIFRVNWRGAFSMIRTFRPLLERSGNGLVVNISSIAGRTGYGSNVAYCASKAALDSLTRSLGRALAPSIRVVSVSPGWVAGDYADKMPQELIETEAAQTPLGRIAHADEVAQAVLAVCTLLPFTTGSIIPVDGGRPLGTP